VLDEQTEDVTSQAGTPPTDDVIADRKKKSRTVFSRRQVVDLESTFAGSRYLSSDDRSRLAARLQLSETQVKIWFQNRRNKWKRQVAGTGTAAHAHCLRAPASAADAADVNWNGVGGAATLAETSQAMDQFPNLCIMQMYSTT